MRRLTLVIFACLVSSCRATRQAHGFDASDANGPSDEIKEAELNSDFVYYRSTWGRHQNDTQYAARVARAAARHTPYGAIHTAEVWAFRGADDANHFWSVISEHHPPGAVSLPAAVEVNFAPSPHPMNSMLENTPEARVVNTHCHGVPPSVFRHYLDEFVSTFTHHAGYPPLIRISKDFWDLCVQGTGMFHSGLGMYPLWIVAPCHPHELATTSLMLPAPWSHGMWTYWQYGNVGQNAGHLNLFFSDNNDLREYARDPLSLARLQARRQLVCPRRLSSSTCSVATSDIDTVSPDSDSYRSDSERDELKHK